MNFFSLFKRNLIYNLKKKVSVDTDQISLKSLDKLFHHYGSDKAEIWKKTNQQGHGFSNFYEKKLERYENKKINILEIGSLPVLQQQIFQNIYQIQIFIVLM